MFRLCFYHGVSGVVHQVDFSFVGEKFCIAETPFACCGQKFLGLFDLSSLRRVCQAQQMLEPRLQPHRIDINSLSAHGLENAQTPVESQPLYLLD